MCVPPPPPHPVGCVGCERCACRCAQARREAVGAGGEEEKKAEAQAQPDDLIAVRQLRGRRAATAVEVDLDDEADITKGARPPPPSVPLL